MRAPQRPLVSGGLAPIYSERATDLDAGPMGHFACGKRGTVNEDASHADYSQHGGRGVSQMDAPQSGNAARAGRLGKLQRVLGDEAPDDGVAVSSAPIMGAQIEALIEEEERGASTAAETVRLARPRARPGWQLGAPDRGLLARRWGATPRWSSSPSSCRRG
jgi:hypothetical protein